MQFVMKTMRKTQTIVEIIEPDVMANPMRRHCQFTVKRSEKRVDLTVASEQQPCGVQVVERVDLVGLNYSGFFRFNF